MTTMNSRRRSNSTTQKVELQPMLTGLPSLPPPEAPRFPTFQELVDLEATTTKGTGNRHLSDLFDGTLGDQTRLVEDFQKNPDKYGEECHDLLQRLGSGNLSTDQLSPHDRRLLNLATLDYHQAVHPKKKPPEAGKAKGATSKGKPAQRTARFNKVQTEKPRPGIDVPVTELPAYWWLQ